MDNSKQHRRGVIRLCSPDSAGMVVPMTYPERFCQWCGTPSLGTFTNICTSCFLGIIGMNADHRRDLYNNLPDRTFSALYTKMFGRRGWHRLMRRAYRWQRTWKRKRQSHLIQIPVRLQYAHACRMARAQCVRAGYVQITLGLWFNPADRFCYIQNHIVVPCDEVVSVVK